MEKQHLIFRLPVSISLIVVAHLVVVLGIAIALAGAQFGFELSDMWSRIVVVGLPLIGLLLLTISLTKVFIILRLVGSDRLRSSWLRIFAFICVLMIGYVTFAFQQLLPPPSIKELLPALILFSGAGFVLSIVSLSLRTTAQIVHDNANLERRVAARTAELDYIASHDPLTGLSNRTRLMAGLDEGLRRVGRGELLAVLALDVDHFKLINDTYGHHAGDLMLKEIAARLACAVRSVDLVARFGGDEFIVVESMISQSSDAMDLAYRIIETMQKPMRLGDHDVVAKLSVGVAVSPRDGRDAEQMLRAADIALYRAKASGGSTARMYEPEEDERLRAQKAFEDDVRLALGKNQFSIHYQPLVDAQKGTVCGLEALIRWNHPTRGNVSPAEFIPVAEKIGAIHDIGKWVLLGACKAAAKWPDHLKIAVNMSALELLDENVGSDVCEALAAAGLSPSRLELEITETALLDRNAPTLRRLQRLKALGVRIALDDFGTGYSSLSYLRAFPFDKVKIDRSFIAEMHTDPYSREIVQAVTGLCRNLAITSTAEGIETAEQAQALKIAGCTQLQGFYFSRPLPEADIPAAIRTIDGLADEIPAIATGRRVRR